MRRLEVALIALTLAVSLASYVGEASEAGAIALLLVLIAHVQHNGARWQLAPLYVVATFAAVSGALQPQLAPVLGGIVFFGGSLLVLASLALGIGLPIRTQREPAGPYDVGTSTFHLDQLDRVDIHGDGQHTRQLMMQVWYPAHDTGQPAAEYLPDFRVGHRMLTKAFGMPWFGLRHLNLIYTSSSIDSPLAHSEDQFSVLLFSHGRSGTRGQNTFQFEELASHGYVVAAVDHPYGAGYTVYPNGRAIAYDRSIFGDDSPAQAGVVGAEWVKDLTFVIDTLEDLNAEEGIFDGGLDLDRVGIFGHSTGGGAAMDLCALDSRCGPVLAYDPWLVPTSDSTIAQGLNEPLLVLRQPRGLGPTSDGRLRELVANTDAATYVLNIEGTKHLDFNDYKILVPAMEWVGVMGDIDAEVLHEILNTVTRAFFDTHLRGFPEAEALKSPSPFDQVNTDSRLG